ncbi:MAG: four helix bundle protein [Planctomycetota bacterium]
MAGVKNFTDLRFWKRAREWSKDIFRRTQKPKFKADHRLVAQINDSFESVIANIAEGFGRGTQGEFIQFLGYASGSLNETQAHLCAAYDRDYLAKDDFAELFQSGTEIRRMMVTFMKSMTMPGSGVKNIQSIKIFGQRRDEHWERFERLTGKQRPEWLREIEAREAELDDED